MTDRPDDIQRLLNNLGKAHRDGAFSSDPARYPWQTAKPEVTGLARRRFAWARVAVPLSAAAVVAILFVAPSLLNTPAVDSLAKNIPVLPEVVQEGSAEVVLAENCDFNHDGVVNARDISAFNRRALEGSVEDLQLEEEAFLRCLLSGT